MLSFFRGFLRQRGSVLLLTGLLLPFVIGVTGLAVDVGNLYLTQSRLQNAADAAALAGAADIRDDLIAHRATVQGVKANHSAADNVAGGYVDDNLGKDVASRGYDVPEASAAQLKYKVSLTEDVPLYFLRVFIADKTRSVGAASTAAIIGKGKTATSKHLFVFKDGMEEVNSINNPDNMNIKGQISSTFDGDIAYTDGVTSGAPDYTPIANPSYFPPQGIQYSSQNANLKYFFTKQAADENCSVTEAEANGYGHQANYTAYDMDALHRQVTAMTQVRYTNGQNPDSSESIFDQNTSTAIYIKEPNVNLSVNRLPGSDTKPNDPVYLNIADSIGVVNINVNSDNVRPLVVCYNGKGEIHFNMQGHTFRGIIYAPNSPKILCNAGGGNFYGSMIASGLNLRNDRGHFFYEDFDGGSGSAATGGASSDYEIKLL